MRFASILLILFFFISATYCSEPDRNNKPKRDLREMVQQVKEAAPVLIDSAMVQIHKYPIVPAILTTALMRRAKEAVLFKRSSFVIWAFFAVALAEPYRRFAQNYFQLKEAERYKRERSSDSSEELQTAIENVKISGQTVITAVTNEVLESVSEKINDILSKSKK